MAFLNRKTPPHIVTLVLATGVAALSLNIFLPSLPGMARHFGVDYGLMQLAVSAYLAASAVAQFVIGPISDRYGRRPVLLWVVAIFTLASVVALFAPNAHAFLAARFVQAVVATAFVLARAAVRDMVPGPGAASMIGYVTMGMSLVPMIGPAVGGLLDGLFGWQANLAVLALSGALLFALVWADMGETVSGGGLGFGAQMRAYPILLRSPRFWGYALSAAASAGLFYAYLGGAALVGEQAFGLSPVEVGYFFALPSLGYLIGNWISGRFSLHLGMDRMVLSGTVLATAAIAVALIAKAAGVLGPITFFTAVGVTGIGNGLSLPSANAGLMSVRADLAGTASGLGATMTIGTGAVLASLTATFLGAEVEVARLLWVMFGSSALSVAAILWVMRRPQ
ncbi:multidrug effflux MFS transporter [Rhodobacter capsulatus]|jgi:DHA1 family bicyclomycin/chloramphenicol resistance-like MFS transporter|uniref:Major facilitator superfamily MFS_1 n=2 Tax=Rhodobacter capsulatus TaxID=1061 RepID=D5AQ82_RHOCB|nr:multidrug effflux MFS transporter [Rhodobacter capsulatus]ADE84669.1 major facilitator superfamily MFS_1 [Rhodobacter capsulatus SB 1003]ETD02630.1 multidrug MFS transporter [Rhodobacter capsulatus DE442]ETD78727.1 multidrug MFS transporter [Rhodobacter capsulatus R121]ETD82291.1 multidrug MFS transporter [Rhodobacter capsulatus YW1]ETD89061.1 multidrug MFS transporter [Rhodobacter capsulatus YW2]